jgi:threonylcarbamoyladenosine tRNA methylthiotransferase MtaB
VKEKTKIAFDSLGCKLNQAETEAFIRQLTETGYDLVSSADEADVYILNTCTVTHIADRKSRHLLRQAYRQNPDIQTVPIGCYANGAPQELTRLEGVAFILSNEEKPYLRQRLEEAGCLSRPQAPRVSAPVDGQRTRTFVKIQDGCYGVCTYCVVPQVRGSETSLPANQIVAEIKRRVSEGAKEVVLTGTEIGRYRHDSFNFKGLVERILAETDVTRLRLSSLQPQEISNGLIGLWPDRRLCPHFHMSLQSGSDTVLGRMKRQYTTVDYQQVVSLIRDRVPEAAITTDIIVGFPGETEAEFRESLAFCRQIEFARIHVFAYSPRRGTEAAQMPNQVGAQIKKQRSQQMLALAAESARNFSRRFLGGTRHALWEKGDNNLWSGHTANYIKVYARSDKDLTNQLLPVKLESLWRDGVWGNI